MKGCAYTWGENCSKDLYTAPLEKAKYKGSNLYTAPLEHLYKATLELCPLANPLRQIPFWSFCRDVGTQERLHLAADGHLYQIRFIGLELSQQ